MWIGRTDFLGDREFMERSWYRRRLRDEFEMSNHPSLRSTCILWVINTIKHDNVTKIERAQPGKAGNIDTVLIGIERL
jgi:hypothetical protein